MTVRIRVERLDRTRQLLEQTGPALRPQPAHDPVPVSATGDASATILFMKFGGGFEVKRTDFVRVKPYSERFGVKIGPMKALDF